MWYIRYKPLYNVLLPLNLWKTDDRGRSPNKCLCQMMVWHLSFLVYHSQKLLLSVSSVSSLRALCYFPPDIYVPHETKQCTNTNVPMKLWHFTSTGQMMIFWPALQSETYVYHINVQAEFCAGDLTGELEFTIKINSHFRILWWSFKLSL